ncbi:MAG: AbrB/MazE/SpoVT family DNA-binding domain-containing protein [Candidatus Bathyarchaeia archaeon]
MEIKIGNKGRVTIPSKLRLLLGIKEGDSLSIEVSGSGILLKPKGATLEETWGLVRVGKVEVEEVEEAAGREII